MVIKLKHIKVITQLYGPSIYPKQLICLHLLRMKFGIRYVEKFFRVPYWRLINVLACVPIPIWTALQIHALLDGEIPMAEITPDWAEYHRHYLEILRKI